MHVLATAGHVDHGKSTLVRALTGQEPDRWAEERRRGMTIDLGYAWTTLPSGRTLAVVDVPGHERFIGNMLAGVGPVTAVLVVVAADEGWRRQSAEHLAAVDALGLDRGLLAVTRSDLADPGPATAQARAAIARSSLGDVEAVAVSGATGQGLDELRAALDRLVARLPEPAADDPVRLWVDRAFTVRGSGTVVTGTLGAGTVTAGDELELRGERVVVRGVQALGAPVTSVTGVARAALNLRGVAREAVARGDVLLTPGAWPTTGEVDVRLRAPLDAAADDADGPGVDAASLPAQLVLHVGTASVPVRVRPLVPGEPLARLRLASALPLRAGDRAVLRDPGRHAVAAGVVVLDADPPPLRRRGAAARWAGELAGVQGAPDLRREVERRGAVPEVRLRALGVEPPTTAPAGLRRVAGWWVSDERWSGWVRDLTATADARAASRPLDPVVPAEEARHAAGLPDAALLRPVADAAGLLLDHGRVRRPGVVADLGAAEAGMAALEAVLTADPFAAPERPQLHEWGLGPRELAAAERVGRLVRLGDDVVLLPTGPARAMRVLAGLEQPFTTSEARQALATTRRVAIPLLEHLDRRGWTRRLDGTRREVVRRG
ncbi:selenocysteine-specific translation elongation factor [Lapillicoccus jejuensis]|uniref:Selenocysteine-specific elongation factor n=1 Tax=Lapillicoccus jejuensis TaxID=402171 RepID=A0A542DXY4_9MICO|nr:selenocysteine-specific translation elongation factor [Lapillicoccus jejuensis]TQJ07794.1 selenocysteine-specific elongation factor [Lapillicoccus jejuensis]